jgi:hypothetical protein
MLEALLRSPAIRRRRRSLRRRISALRKRIAALDPRLRANLAEEARQLDQLRQRVGLLTGAPACCARCEIGLPDGLPHFTGGTCCGGTEGPLTLDAELAALLLAGHRPDRRRTARGLAGCLFRTPTGCTLGPAERPSICVTHMCTDLERELHRRGVLAEILPLCDRLTAGVASIAEAVGVSRSGASW